MMRLPCPLEGIPCPLGGKSRGVFGPKKSGSNLGRKLGRELQGSSYMTPLGCPRKLVKC